MQLNELKIILKKMINSYYRVDGATPRFVKFRIYTDNKRIKIVLTTHPYEYTFSEFGKAISQWVPVNMEDTISYDHRAEMMALFNITSDILVIDAEVLHDEVHTSDIDISPKDSGVIEKIDPDQPALQLLLETEYSKALARMIESSNFADVRLKETMQLLKQEGDKGRAHVPVATQVIKAINAMNLNRQGLIEMFKAGINMSKEHNKQKPKDGKKDNSGNDNQKD